MGPECAIAFDRKNSRTTCEALKRVLHFFSKAKLYYQYPKFLECAEDLLTMEDGREGR